MTRKLSSRLAAAHGFLAKLWKLTAPYFWSEERWSARLLLAIVVGSGVFLVYLAKLLNEGNARFFNALEEKNFDAFWAELRYFVVVALVFIVSRSTACGFARCCRSDGGAGSPQFTTGTGWPSAPTIGWSCPGPRPTTPSSASRRTATRSPARP